MKKAETIFPFIHFHFSHSLVLLLLLRFSSHFMHFPQNFIISRRGIGDEQNKTKKRKKLKKRAHTEKDIWQEEV